MTPQVRSKRKFDASTPTASGELRIRLDTRHLDLERHILGNVARSYEGISALAVLMSERHPCAVMCAAFVLPRIRGVHHSNVAGRCEPIRSAADDYARADAVLARPRRHRHRRH